MRLRPHGRVLVRPALVLVVAAGLAGYAAAAIPDSPQRDLLRGLAGVVLLLVVLRGSVRPFLRWLGTTVTITTARVRTRRGLLRSRTSDLPLSRVSHSTVEQSVLQRLTRSGTLLLHTAGDRGAVAVRDVPAALAVADLVEDLLDALDAELEQDRADADRYGRQRP